MFKNKLFAAGILSFGALALSVPAIASMGIGTRSYSGRYACHEDDGAGPQQSDNIAEGGVTFSYVVYPNGMGGYNAGELVGNAAALWSNPCVFTLETSGGTPSSYWVDPAGVAHETLVWEDDTMDPMDECSGYTFEDTVESSLSLPSPYSPANRTLTTSNIQFTLDSTTVNFAGTGECASSAN
jgi:hypothetical protein